MRCQTKHKILIINLIVLMFLIVPLAYATPTYRLPYNTLIRNGMKVHFGDYWINTTGTNALITAWFENDWINVLVYNNGTQQVYTGEKPRLVYINNIQAEENDGWNYSNGSITITNTTSSFKLFFGSLIPKQFSPLFLLIGFICVLALCFSMYELATSKKIRDFDRIIGLIICTFVVAYIFIQAITYLFTY